MHPTSLSDDGITNRDPPEERCNTHHTRSGHSSTPSRRVYSKDQLLSLRHDRQYPLPLSDPIRALPVPTPLPEYSLKPYKYTDDVITLQSPVLNDLIPSPILRALTEKDVQTLSPIQAAALPATQLGIDVIVQAKSGTGKTLVFAVTALQVSVGAEAIVAVIVAPTRELCLQNFNTIQELGKYLDPVVRVGLLIGGVDEIEDVKMLAKVRPAIIVGTPGRVEALVGKGVVDISRVRLLVLDEADRLLDGALGEAVPNLCEVLPQKKQSIAVSATFPDKLRILLERVMRKPKVIRVGKGEALIGVRQRKISVKGSWKEKAKKVVEMLNGLNFLFCLVFTNEKGCGKGIVGSLKEAGFVTEGMHAEVGQRERDRIMRKVVVGGKVRCLVTTDLLARGVEVPGCDVVVHMDMPERETYLHRVGRAGRFGGFGLSVFVGEGLDGLERRLGFAIRELTEEDMQGELQWMVGGRGESEKRVGNGGGDGGGNDQLCGKRSRAKNEVHVNERDECKDIEQMAVDNGGETAQTEEVNKVDEEQSKSEVRNAENKRKADSFSKQVAENVYRTQSHEVQQGEVKNRKLWHPPTEFDGDWDMYARRAFDEGYKESYTRAYRMAMQLGKRLGWGI